MATRHVISQETDLWPTSIRDPEIQVAVVVPVDSSYGSPVIGKVKPADRRNICVSPNILSKVQEATVALVTTERTSASNERKEHGTHGAFQWINADRHPSMRHDLSPEEASQVTGIFSRNVAVCDEQIFPAVVVQVGKDRAPCPPSHLHGRFRAHFAERSVASVFE